MLTSLKTLGLELNGFHSQIDEKSLNILCESLRQLTDIRDLILAMQDSQLSKENFLAFGEILTSSKKLTSLLLDFVGCKSFDNEVFKLFISRIGNLCFLTNFFLGLPSIVPDQMTCFITLAAFSQLKRLTNSYGLSFKNHNSELSNILSSLNELMKSNSLKNGFNNL